MGNATVPSCCRWQPQRKLPSSECASGHLAPALVGHTQLRHEKTCRETSPIETSLPEGICCVAVRQGENYLKLRMQRSKHTVHKGDTHKESPGSINSNGDQRWEAGLPDTLSPAPQHPMEPSKDCLASPHTHLDRSFNQQMSMEHLQCIRLREGAVDAQII